MYKKKYLIFAITIATVVTIGIFLALNNNRTFFIKNDSPYLANLHPNSNFKLIADDIGDLSKTIIPRIKTTENLTENFAQELTRGLISKNTEPKVGDLLPGPGVNMPNPSALAEKFIKDGLKKANENILNINPPQLQISSDNSKKTEEKYLAEIQIIINNNLKTGNSLISILEDINKNKGQGLEKLVPITSAYETTANQIEQVPAPSNLKNLTTEEIKLLRITANVLRALTNIESDPLSALTATQQFGIVIQNWIDLQKKFDVFIQKLNRA